MLKGLARGTRNENINMFVHSNARLLICVLENKVKENSSVLFLWKIVRKGTA